MSDPAVIVATHPGEITVIAGPHNNGIPVVIEGSHQGPAGPQGPPGTSDGMLSVKDFGAVGDGVADDTAEIQAALAAGLAQRAAVFFDPGVYRTTSTLIVHCDVVGAADTQIVSSANPAVQLGTAASALVNRKVSLPSIMREAATLGTGVGLHVLYAVSSLVTIPRVNGFADGVRLTAANTVGVAYNTFTVGEVMAYTRLLVFDPAPGGWCNQNTFIGGRWQLLTSGTAVTGTRGVQLGTAAAEHRPVMNQFVGCCFEGDIAEFHVETYASYNTFNGCSFEAAGAARFAFRVRSPGAPEPRESYSNVFENCLFNALAVTNETGTHGNGFRSYFADDHIVRDGPQLIAARNSGDSVLTLFAPGQDIYTANAGSTNWQTRIAADIMGFKNTADTNPRFSVVALDGSLNWGPGNTTVDTSLSRGYAAGMLQTVSVNPVFRMIESISGDSHIGVFRVDPAAGFIEIESTLGSGTAYPIRFLIVGVEKLRVGASAITATVPITPLAAATGSRPAASSVPAGAMMYDTTLGKPIWSNGTAWRDAAGTAA